MTYDLDFLRACCKDDAAYARLLQHLELNVSSHDVITRETFARVFRFSPEPIVITRLDDGQALALNEAFTHYTGYSEAEFYTTNPQLWADRSQRDIMVNKLKQDGVIHNFAGELRHKDGHILYGLISGETITYQGEDALLVMLHDITNYVITAEKLRKSEERYRRVIDYQTDVICAYTPDARFTFINEAYGAYFGYQPHELVGTSLFNIIPEEIQERINRQIAQLLVTKKPIQYESEVRHESGAWRWLQWVDRPILDKDGNVAEIQAVGRDVTDRKHAEIRMQLLLSSLPRTAIVIYNQELEFTTIEGSIKDIIGLSANEMMGKKPEDIFIGEHIENTQTLMKRVLKGEELEFEYIFMGRTLRIQMYPIRQADAVIAGAVVSEDITERKEAEKQALQFTLERNRVQIITDFITNAQHEFRTPLSVIASSLYIAERAKDREKQVQALHKARGQVEAISHLVDELTMMARLDAEIDIKKDVKKSTNPHYLVKFALDDVAHRASAKHITLETDFDESVSMMEVHQQLFAHAIVQILDNAIQHTPEGGIIHVQTRCQIDSTTITIADTGAGIAKDAIDHIFERFYRQDSAHSTRGFGLGLPIAEKIINIHGGTIRASNIPDAGAVFTITLPHHPAGS